MLISDWLSHHPEHCATLAAWLHRQFPYEFSQQPLEDWQAEFAAGQHNGEWRMRVALQDGEPVGCAGLARDDLPQRPDLSPWLACVYVHPEARGQGLAGRLIEEVCAEARALGHTRLYLHTQDRADYYERRGWQRLDSFTAWGMTHQLMCRPL